MTLESSVTTDQKKLIIRVDGVFDFSLHDEFRQAQTLLQKPIIQCVVDLSAATVIDSSALGILLVLQEQAAAIGARVALANSPKGIQATLAIANFYEIFDLIPAD